MTSNPTRTETLYFTQGSSDKVYQAAVEASGDGFIVTFAYGRRGSTLTTGTKTSDPVSLDKATKIFEGLLQSKKAKGYTPGKDGVAYQFTDKESRDSGFHCQLLNVIEEEEAMALLEDPEWGLQEKLDGKNISIQKEVAGEPVGINKLGLTVGIPVTFIEGSKELGGRHLICGEAIGDTLHVFDLLELDDEDLRPLGYGERHARLKVCLVWEKSLLEFVELWTTVKDKKREFSRLEKEGKEGVVFKRLAAPFSPGRPNSGGDQLKYKFYATASFVVTQRNGEKRSVAVQLLDKDGKFVPAGNVTIPPNHEVPEAGAIVEVRYLYAFPESGVIYQPIYLGVRDDTLIADCTTKQLKLKASENSPS
jgi:bifunctional non-homologous end joining protein LigD